MRSANAWLLATLFGLAAAFAGVLAWVRPTFDLAYYLPEPATVPESVLVERMGQGAGARLIFAEIVTPEGDAPALAASMREKLATTDHFLRVENGSTELSFDAIPQRVWQSRYLLADVDWSESGLRASLQQRLDDLALMGGEEVSALIRTDPVGAAPQILQHLASSALGATPRWTEGGSRAFLMLETHAPPFDFAAQQAAVDAINATYRSLTGSAKGLSLYGVGVYGASIQRRVQSESTVLGIAASLAVLLVVWVAYRSWRLMLVSLVPLACALLGGLFAASFAFGTIHGITIAFGATLVGVVDDYPLHVFSHARHADPRSSVRRLFVTLLASGSTAIVAYAALALSGSRGLAQLGVFSLCGVFCAMLATCLLLPRLMAPKAQRPPENPELQRLNLSIRVWLPLTVLSLALLVGTGHPRWSDDPSELTPLPAELLASDHAMRERFGAPDPRTLISLEARSVEKVLQATENLETTLAEARSLGHLDAWSAVTTLVPSAATQQRRAQAIPEAQVLSQRFASALDDLPFRSDAMDGFLADATSTRTMPVLLPSDFEAGLPGDYVRSHLSTLNGTWRSTIYLGGLSSATTFQTWLTQRQPQATLVDLKSASESLLQSYRQRLISVLAIALLAIALIVAATTRNLRRFLWCAGTVTGAILVTVAAMQWLSGPLTLFHLVSLVLVAGLGVDYCLFYSRPDISRTEYQDSGHAMLACAASTVGAFAILAASSIPMLSAIGATVALGTATLYLMARIGCRPI